MWVKWISIWFQFWTTLTRSRKSLCMAHEDAFWRVLLWPEQSWQGRRAAYQPPIVGERGNPPDTYRGDQRKARLVRNLYHIFLLYTTILSSFSSSFQNRFRSVRGRAQWARHGESSTSSERVGKEATRERMTG